MRRVSSVAWKIVCQMDHVLFDPVPFENNLLKTTFSGFLKEAVPFTRCRGKLVFVAEAGLNGQHFAYGHAEGRRRWRFPIVSAKSFFFKLRLHR